MATVYQWVLPSSVDEHTLRTSHRWHTLRMNPIQYISLQIRRKTDSTTLFMLPTHTRSVHACVHVSFLSLYVIEACLNDNIVAFLSNLSPSLIPLFFFQTWFFILQLFLKILQGFYDQDTYCVLEDKLFIFSIYSILNKYHCKHIFMRYIRRFILI